MRTAVPVIYLAIVLAFFVPLVPAELNKALRRRPKVIFLIAALLAAAFWLITWRAGAFALPLALVILAYTFVPSIVMFVQGAGSAAATWLDLAAILLLWLPIELNLGAQWVPRHAQGFVHTVAYGTGITLALVLFLGFRGWKGMKYQLPARAMDLVDPLIAFVLVAPVLILLGRVLSFIPPFHVPGNLSAAVIGKTIGLIFVATALPEEILFRALIQNWLMQKFGASTAVLIVASVIFGCAHLNNGPQALPNWRYMILATIAGFAYGKVFERASSITASALLHALVDATKHVFF
ncbi:MAG TPA: type II CAAX endopeptidase family protein [Bryobacteraceae bacterium]|nr:type II CAAX endopeptidase family protein [Bryobacteraceae bacterium]